MNTNQANDPFQAQFPSYVNPQADSSPKTGFAIPGAPTGATGDVATWTNLIGEGETAWHAKTKIYESLYINPSLPSRTREYKLALDFFEMAYSLMMADYDLYHLSEFPELHRLLSLTLHRLYLLRMEMNGRVVQGYGDIDPITSNPLSLELQQHMENNYKMKFTNRRVPRGQRSYSPKKEGRGAAFDSWAQMRILWSRLMQFATANNLPVSEPTALLFLHSMEVSVQTKHTYVRNLINIFRKTGQNHTQLTMYDTALRASGALIPMHQAVPLTREDLLTVIENVSPMVRMSLLLAWKTASRWDEIARLTAKSILSQNPTEIILYFGQETKTSRTTLFRPDLFAVITGQDTQELHQFLLERRDLIPKDKPLIPIRTEEITELLLPYGFSAHSLKRGAILALYKSIPVGDPRIPLIPLLAKHAPHFHALPTITCRYVDEHTVVARHLGTGLLTCLL